jgi:hypothetical protein
VLTAVDLFTTTFAKASCTAASIWGKGGSRSELLAQRLRVAQDSTSGQRLDAARPVSASPPIPMRSPCDARRPSAPLAPGAPGDTASMLATLPRLTDWSLCITAAVQRIRPPLLSLSSSHCYGTRFRPTLAGKRELSLPCCSEGLAVVRLNSRPTHVGVNIATVDHTTHDGPRTIRAM